MTSPEGRCPDPDDVVVMGNGAYQVQRCADRLEEALASVPADRTGWSQTQFISAFDHEHSRGSYLALESFTGTVDGRQGTCNLAHRATTFGGPERAHEPVLIVPFSGTGDLAGTGTIRLDPDGTHRLEL